MKKHRWLGVILGVVFLVGARARGGEAEKAPPKVEPVSEADKAKLLAAETPKQRALRAELSRLKTKIFFNSNADGKNNIYIVNANGTGLEQITVDGGAYPHLSPDGKRVVFVRGETLSAEELKTLPVDPKWPFDWKRVRKGKGTNFIWLMNSDGSEARRVTQGSLPHWSPNGKVIAYTVPKHPRQHRPGLFDIENETEKVLDLPGMKVGGFPCFTPDGRGLFVSNGPGQFIPLNEAGTGAAEGAKVVAKAINGHPCNVEISPDGKWITWVTDTHKCLGSWLFYASFDAATGKVGRGKKLDLGWDKKTVNYFPDFSPCGKYFAYVHAGSEDGVKSWLVTKKQELYVARFPADGTAVRLTWTNAASQHPHWTREPVLPEKKEE